MADALSRTGISSTRGLRAAIGGRHARLARTGRPRTPGSTHAAPVHAPA